MKLNGIKLPVLKCKKPSFSNVKGMTWDTGKMIVDGIEVTLHLDTTWGEYVYFQDKNGNWFKIKMFSTTENDLKGKSYDLDPFGKCVLTQSNLQIERDEKIESLFVGSGHKGVDGEWIEETFAAKLRNRLTSFWTLSSMLSDVEMREKFMKDPTLQSMVFDVAESCEKNKDIILNLIDNLAKNDKERV